MVSLLVGAILAMAAPPPAQALAEAGYAIEAGRLDQARIMIGNAIKAGAHGHHLDRLIADLAFARGDFAMSLQAYEALLAANSGDSQLSERAGIAALRLQRFDRAEQLLNDATRSSGASWRAWNALGVLADHRSDWIAADEHYHRALSLGADRSQALNNMGWSQLLRGSWREALELFERAAAADPDSVRIRDNLELARAANSNDLPQRRPSESDGAWAARLNDAGVIANLQGDRQRAIAAFTRALEARPDWFARAANNLAATGATQ